MCLIRLPINDGKNRYYILKVTETTKYSYLLSGKPFGEIEPNTCDFRFITYNSDQLAATMTVFDFAISMNLKNEILRYFLKCMFEFLDVDATIIDSTNEEDWGISKQNAKEYVNNIPVFDVYCKNDDWYVCTIERACRRVYAEYYTTNGQYEGIDFLRYEFGKI